MKIENISTLKINRLTQEQYEKARAEDKLNDSELYFTPASPTGGDIDVTEYAYSKTETYNRSEVDAKIPSLDGYAKTSDIPDISGKQDKLTFDGTYNASTNKAATVQTVRDEVAKIVADAPEDFNTLKEMSTWIAEHTDSAATMNRAIQKNTQDIANMQEEIVSEKDEFHIVDANDNIVATIDKDGVRTTTVTADAVVVNGNDIATALNNIVTGMRQNYVSQTSFSNVMTKLIDGTTPVAKATTATTADSATTATTATSLAPVSSRTWTTGTIDNSGSHPSVAFPALSDGLYGVMYVVNNTAYSDIVLLAQPSGVNGGYIEVLGSKVSVYQNTFFFNELSNTTMTVCKLIKLM